MARVRGTADPALPPRWLQLAVGGADYRGVGDLFRGYFVELGGLEPHHDVLDVGSGSGRMAYALKDWLTGRYEGFDIMPAAVEWCRREITPRHPNFTFQVADVRSERYNPGGTTRPPTTASPIPTRHSTSRSSRPCSRTSRGRRSRTTSASSRACCDPAAAASPPTS